MVCQAAGDWRPSCVREPFCHRVCRTVLGLEVSNDGNGNHCPRRQHWFEFAEDRNEMDSVRLFTIQSILEVLGKQIRFFDMSWPLPRPKDMCGGYIENSMPCTDFACFGFLETWKRPWRSGPESDYCELASEFSTFSTPDPFQVHNLTDIYDKTRVY